MWGSRLSHGSGYGSRMDRGFTKVLTPPPPPLTSAVVISRAGRELDWLPSLNDVKDASYLAHRAQLVQEVLVKQRQQQEEAADVSSLKVRCQALPLLLLGRSELSWLWWA